MNGFFQNAGTEEKTSILICEGYQEGNCEVTRVIVNSLQEGLYEVNSVSRTFSIEPEQCSEISETHILRQGFRKTRLGDIFTIKIGIVIGASKLLTYKKKGY